MKAKDIIGSRRITNEDASSLIASGKKLVGKKVLPAVGFTDAAMRANDEDWVGAGIGTVAGGLGLVPPTSPYGIAAQAGSISLETLNQLRDLAKERGGWGNLGKDMYQSIKTQGYDPSFLPEDFEELDRLDEQGLLEEPGGLRGLLIRKGIDAADYLKNLVTRKKPDAPKPEWTPGPKVDVTPPKAPDVTPPPVKDRGVVIDIRKEFKRIEAERIAKAEAEAAERAAEAAKKIELEKAAEAERLRNIQVPKKKPLESDKAYLQRLEKMGPEFVQKKTQMDQALIIANQAKELNKGPIRKGLETTGKFLVKNPITFGAGLYGGYEAAKKYGPAVADWALGKGIDTLQNIDTSNARPLPLGNGPYDDNKEPAPAPADNKPADSAPAPAPAPAPTSAEDPNEPRPGRKEFGDQSRAPNTAAPLSEKEQQYSKKQYIAWAAKYAKLYDVPLPVVLHAMRKETGSYDADTAATIRGPKTRYGQAVGVMQLMPTFFKTLKPEDFTNPEKNIEACTRFLAKLYNTYGNPEAALAAYNAGPNSPGFKNWLKSKNPKDLPAQTREYLYGDPRKKTVGYVDDAEQQIALLNPPTTRDKVARVATDVIAAATGSSNAQAAEKSKEPEQQASANPKLVPIDKRIAGRMENLDPVFRQRLEKALEKYPGELKVTSANRLPHEQNKLYQAFITGLSKIPASRELASHSGYAIDVDRSDLAKFHKWLQAEKKAGNDYGLETGLEWGGKDRDPVHIQARNWQKIEQEQRVAKKEQDRLDKEAKNRKQQRDTDTRIAQAEPQKAPEKKAEKPADKIDPLTGARAAQAEPANKGTEKTVPQKDSGGQGGASAADRSGKTPAQPTAVELAKITQRLNSSKDPVKELETIIKQAEAAGKKTDALKKELDQLKQDYEKDKAKLAADEPGTVRIGPVKITAPSWLTGKDDKSAAKKSSPVPSEMPSVDDYGNVIEPGKITKPAAKSAEVKPADKVKPKTYTTTDTQGKTTTYTQNEKGQWIDPRGNILPMPEKPGSKKDLSISDKGEEPSAADLEKARKITGRTDPIIDPQTGYPTTEKELKAKLEKQAAEKRAAADREANSQSDTSNKAVDKKSDKKADTSNQAPLVIPPGLKDRIAKDSKNKADANPPVVIPSELKNLEKNTARKDFEQAFKAARDEKGAGNTFNWTNPLTGKEGTYTTDYKQEKKNATTVKKPDQKIDQKIDQEFDTKSFNLKDKETDNKTDTKPFDPPVDKDVLDKLTKKDSWNTERNAPVTSSIKINPATGNADSTDSLPPIEIITKPEKANVWRDSSGRPVTNRYGEPWGTGTSNKDDIEAAKIELQQQADAAKAKEKLQAISPDLSKPPESSWKDIWDQGIENLTGKKRMTKDELNTIRVPESINNELDDILRLAGRKK